jgi:hypothetical protein
MAKINTHIAKIKNVDFPTTASSVISFTNPNTETVDVLLTSDKWPVYLKEYLSWSFIALGDDPGDTETYNTFLEVWNSFYQGRFTNYQQIYTSIVKEYDPLWNYDKTSKITTDTGAQTDKSVFATRTDKNINPQVTSEATDGVSPYDSSTFSNRTKTESKVNAYTVQNEYGGHTDELQKGARKDTVDEHTYGNIGTVTNVDLWRSEYENRRFNFLKDIIEDFAKECLFLCEMI